MIPILEFTTAPAEIVTDPVPLLPMKNRPVSVAADVEVRVVPVPVMSPGVGRTGDFAEEHVAGGGGQGRPTGKGETCRLRSTSPDDEPRRWRPRWWSSSASSAGGDLRRARPNPQEVDAARPARAR